MTLDLPKEYVELYNRVAVWVVGNKTVKAKYGEARPTFTGVGNVTVSGTGGGISVGAGSGISVVGGLYGGGGGGGSYSSSWTGVNGKITAAELMWNTRPKITFRDAAVRTRQQVLSIWKEWATDNEVSLPAPVTLQIGRLRAKHQNYLRRGKPSGLIAEAYRVAGSSRRSP